MVHPYLRLNSRRLRSGSLYLSVGFLIATAIFAASVPTAHMSAVSGLVRADPQHAQHLLASWDAATRESFRFMLGFDYLYDILHNNLAAFVLAWGAVRFGKPWAIGVAGALVWILWLDSGLNVLENMAYTHILTENAIVPWHRYASGVFAFRSVSLLVIAVAALALHLAAFRNR
jgi:hypothetical protein